MYGYFIAEYKIQIYLSDISGQCYSTTKYSQRKISVFK